MSGFRTYHDLDSSTTFCPCGAAIQREGLDDYEAFKAWKVKHNAHADTDEETHIITDDGMRCLDPDTKREWTTNEGGIKIAVGSKNGAVVIDFGTPVAWIGFSPQEARDIASSLVKHADHLEPRTVLK